MSSREQQLVNAQVWVNRAVHHMNCQMSGDDSGYGVPSDEQIAECIKGAIESLVESRKGYAGQQELFGYER
ncbi:hypothetical protein R50073_49330 (plasmid) [Maricurvus nonylphenolicus]|jgi:hypothetical protein|uniref:hypothetical protein n=1 Tax=Maricurvus nonylphenolicus TaxID=1008307 RepID=UPI0036F209EF